MVRRNTSLTLCAAALLAACGGSPPASPTCGNNAFDPGETCDGEALGGATCASEGFDGGELACDDECALDTSGCCSNGCPTASGLRCNADRLEECRAQSDGCLGWALDIDCGSSGDVCDDSGGTVQCLTPCVDACAADDTRCQGDDLERCTIAASGCLDWSLETACAATGDLCDSSGGDPACVPPCVDVCAGSGSTRCSGTTIETCAPGALGCLDWQAGVDCALTLQTCDDGGGAAVCITPCVDECPLADDRRCAAGSEAVEICEAGAAGCLTWQFAVDCGATGQVCDDSGATPICVTPCSDACAPGQRCTGEVLEDCVVQASGCRDWQVLSDCALQGDVCDDSGAAPACVCVDMCTPAEVRCELERVEACTVQIDGCYDWQVTDDCGAADEVCVDEGGAPFCFAQVGEDCSVPYVLSAGSHSILWTASQQDYLTSRPSCVPSGTPSGPDIVLSYTAPLDGFVEITVEKDPNNRLAMVMTTEACGGLTEAGCFSDFANDELVAALVVTNGTTYTFYVVDTTSGTEGLPNPLELTLTEAVCLDVCAAAGEMRCLGERVETCTPNALGCLDWALTADCTTTSQFCNDGSGTPQCLSCEDTCDVLGSSRCNGTVIEDCAVAVDGCTAWAPRFDCNTGPSIVCDDTLGAPTCALSTGEDCLTAYLLREGSNTVAWTATAADYLTTTPGCVSSGTLTGPDLVLRYTATASGFIDIDMSKPTSTRYGMVISNGACGTLTPELACVSDFTNATMGTTIPVSEGTTYYLYLSDTTSGTNPLPNPFDLDITVHPCVDTCSPTGQTRCSADFLQTCEPGPLGCLEWTFTSDCAFTGGVCDQGSTPPQCAPCLDNCTIEGDTRCSNDTQQSCRTTPLGCLDWQVDEDCAAAGEFCFDGGSAARCAVLSGETCANAYLLTAGDNVVDWVAFDLDHLILAPSCQTTGAVTPPDVVMQYTSPVDGYVDLVMQKPASARMSMVVTAGTCGVLTPEVTCLSDSTPTVLRDTFAVTAGTTYWIYAVDTTSGTAALPNPLLVQVLPSQCPLGARGDLCPALGDTSCESVASFTSTRNAPIPSAAGNATTCGGATSFVADAIVVTDPHVVTDVDVNLDITHTFDGDLDIFLGFTDSAGGTHCVELSTDTGSTGDNFTDTTFDDEALLGITQGTAPFSGRHRPEGALAVLDGLTMSGTWTLYVSDDASGDEGVFHAWRLDIGHNGGTVIQTCTPQLSGCLDWSAGVDCAATGQLCAAASGTATCGTCRDTCLDPDQSRCRGDLLETCTVNVDGCYDWTLDEDCAATGGLCIVDAAGAACLAPLGESCASPAPLVLGTNVVDWVAFTQDHITTPPSCMTVGTLTGPDVVFTTTPAFSGELTFTLTKPTSTRYAMVVSQAQCGVLTSPLACVSDFSAASMGGTVDVQEGVPVWFYLVDSSSGSNPLPDPVHIELACENACTAGASRCVGDLIQTCAPNAAGCLGWVDGTDCTTTGQVCDPGGGPAVCAACTDRCPAVGDPRCDGSLVQECSVDALGCLDWMTVSDCAPSGELCRLDAGLPVCYLPVAEDCGSALALSEGLNTVAWLAFQNDYLTTNPACQAAGNVTGPDLVFTYTAQNDGYLDLRLQKVANMRHTVVVSDAPCGTLTPELACVSDFTNTSMGGILAVTSGTTYVFYLVDSTSGANPLPNPLLITIDETACPAGAAGDQCAAAGAQQCGGRVVATRTPSLAIPDAGGAATTCAAAGSVSDAIVMSDTRTIADVEVEVSLTHPNLTDLDLFLGFVDGGGASHCVQLSTDNGSSGDNAQGLIFDDEAAAPISAAVAPWRGRFRPEGPLTPLDGLAMNGTWRLYANDDLSSNVGTLDAWGLSLEVADGQTIETCTARADGCLMWQSGVDCAGSGEFCNTASGAPTCLPCEDTCPLDGDARCSGDSLERCLAGPDLCFDWTLEEDCAATGNLCDPVAEPPQCVVCIDACPSDGALRCDGAVIDTCVLGALGCLEWQPTTDCALNDQVCDATTGTPECIDCTSSCALAGETQCAVSVDESRTPNASIPDASGSTTTCGGATAFASSSITVVRTDLITDVDVGFAATHTFDGDLDIFLGFIDGTGTPHCVELSTDNGSTGDNFIGTTFDDEASALISSGVAPFTGSFRPEGSLAALDGLSMQGVWTLYVSDDVGSDVGTFDAWSLHIGYGTGTVIELCTVLENGCLAWLPDLDCASTGELCDDSGGAAACVPCLDECPALADTQCNGTAIERCDVGPLGCLAWTPDIDCNVLNPGDRCEDSSGSAVCATPLAEDCVHAAPLALGVNSIDWLASQMDYLSATPACVATGTTTGPDLVLSHTAQFSGALRVSFTKPTNTRWVAVASDAACGALTPQLACISDFSASTMTGTFNVQTGATYHLYVADTTSGTNPLSDPLEVSLSCVDACLATDQRCNGDLVEECQVSAFGCLAWQTVTDCSATGETCDEFGGPPTCGPCVNTCGAAGTTQCTSEVIETCTPDGLGCLLWVGGVDCATTSQVCVDADGSADCATPAGENCADPWLLTTGVNEVVWNSTVADYLTANPSCSTVGTVTGPDVVLSYTATAATGFIDFVMNKPTSTRYTLVASDAACGTLAPQLACVSDSANATMGSRFLSTAGTSYWFYVVDTTSGANPLVNPIVFTLDENDCATFSAVPSGEDPLNGTIASSLQPVLRVNFDAPIVPNVGSIALVGDLGTNLLYDLSTAPTQVTFTNGGQTMTIDPGITFPPSELVTVSWSGLTDALCLQPTGTLPWEFIVPTPSCAPGQGGMIGTTVQRFSTGGAITSITENYMAADNDPAGFVYIGGTSVLYRFPKAGGATENVHTPAGLTTTHLGQAMLIAGSQVFVVDNSTTSTAGRLWRISIDGGQTWNLQDFASFATAPGDDFRAAAHEGGRIYLMTEELTATTGTQIWSVSDTPASLPEAAIQELTFSELGCNGLAMDSVFYYAACSTGDRVVRIDRATGIVELLTDAFNLTTTVNALHVQHLDADGVADAMYLQIGGEDVYYFCDPASAPFSDLMVSFGAATTTNFGLGMGVDAAGVSSLWAFDDDVFEWVRIQ